MIKFIKETIKDSKILIFKNLFMGLFFIILAISINTFEIHDLTYFNAILSIILFSNILSYGISQGLNIYVNQNIKNKKKVVQLIELGFKISFISSVLYALLLFIFKDFIFSRIIVMDVLDSYKLIYLIIPVLVLNVILGYFEMMLANLKEYGYSLLVTAFKYGTIIAGILITILNDSFNIYNLAISYNIAYVIIVPIVYIIFQSKIKKVHFDILKMSEIENIKSKKIIKTILSMSTKEIIWNVGFIMSTMFLLKRSEIIFNSYNYLESITTIFLAFYYAFIITASIKICNHLGDKENKKAYNKAIYTLVFIVFVAFIIGIIYFVFKDVIISYANINIRNTIYDILLVYILITFFRLIDWAFSSYILILGGKLRFLTLVDLIGMIYFITIFIFASSINLSAELTLLLVGLDSIVKTIINLIYFRSKKWMSNVNLD